MVRRRGSCDAIGISRPIVFGHSMGGWIVLLYGARHPGHAGGLMVLGTMARFDLDRLTDGFLRAGGAELAEVARRSFRTADVTEEEWAPVFAAYGPNVPNADEMARRVQNPEVGVVGRVLMRKVDAVTPVAASEEIPAGLSPGVGSLEILEGAGHFAWLDVPDRCWDVIKGFVASAQG